MSNIRVLAAAAMLGCAHTASARIESSAVDMALPVTVVEAVSAAPAAALPTVPINVGWPETVGLVLLVLSYAVRWFAKSNEAHWVHSKEAVWVVALGSAALEAASKAIQSSGLNAQAVINAALTGVLSAMVMGNPSKPPDKPSGPAKVS